MDSIRKEIEDELKRTRLDKTRLYSLLLKIIDTSGVGEAGPTGPQGPRGPQGPQGNAGPAGPACECKCVTKAPTPTPATKAPAKKAPAKKKAVTPSVV